MSVSLLNPLLEPHNRVCVCVRADEIRLVAVSCVCVWPLRSAHIGEVGVLLA